MAPLKRSRPPSWDCTVLLVVPLITPLISTAKPLVPPARNPTLLVLVKTTFPDHTASFVPLFTKNPVRVSVTRIVLLLML